MFVETNPLFDEFLREHPEHAGTQRVGEMPDGSTELCVGVEAFEAFLRWCLINGHGDPKKVVAFLADEIPRLKAQPPALQEVKRKSTNGTEPPVG